MKVFKNIGDLFVSIVLVIGFYLIFDNSSDVTDWNIEEWIMFLSMIWVFVRFTLGLLVELIRTVIKDIMKNEIINK